MTDDRFEFDPPPDPPPAGIAGRRRFLRGQDLVRWWQDWGRTALRPSAASLPATTTGLRSSVGSNESGNDWRPNGFYTELTKPAMACQWELLLNYGQYPHGAEAGLTALESLEGWEAQLSVFRPNSEISHVNRLAYQAPVPVSAALWDILLNALHLWHLTEGAFDITSGSLSECWGFLKREGRLPNDQELATALEPVGMDLVALDPDSRTVRLLHPGTRLNLGGIGKGWTLDRLGEQLHEQQVDDFVIHGGQSSVLAHGSNFRYSAPPPPLAVPSPQPDAEPSSSPSQEPTTGDASAGLQETGDSAPTARSHRSTTVAGQDQQRTPIRGGWPISLSHPIYPDRSLGEVDLCNRALGTSGSARQFVHFRGKRLSHILDPRTGRPAEGVWSATVLAPTAAQADALGTACFVLGEDGCRRLVETCPDLGVILVVPHGHHHRLVTLGDVAPHWHPKET